MIILSIISKSLRYLFTQRLRAISSLLGVLLGVVAIVTMLSIGEGAKRDSIEQIRLLGMNNIIIRQTQLSEEKKHQKLSQGLSLDDVKKMEQTLPDLQQIAPVKIIEATIHGRLKEMSPEIVVTTQDYASIYNLHQAEGHFITHYDVHHRSLACVLGADVAKELGKDGHVGKIIRIENQLFTIVGVLKQRNWISGKALPMSAHNFNQMIFIPTGTEKGMPWRVLRKNDCLSEIVVQLNNSKNILTTAELIKRTLDICHRGVKDYQMIIPQELIRQAQKTQHTFNLILGSIAFISLLIGGIGIMNVMLATISERTREIGIRRAVGANQFHILSQFLAETLMLTLCGAVLGIVVGACFSAMISLLAGWKTIITLWSILLSLSLAFIVGMISGLYPALKASRMSPITALRSF